MKIFEIILIVLVAICLIAVIVIKIIGKKPVAQVLEKEWEIPQERFEQGIVDEFKSLVDNSKELHVVRYEEPNRLSPDIRTAVLVSYSPLVVRDIISYNSLQKIEEIYDLFDNVLEDPENHLGKEKVIDVSQLLAPIELSHLIFGIGLNYLNHSEEVGEDTKFTGSEMVVFGKNISSLTGPYSDVVKPDEVELMDYEIELGIVIGQKIDEGTVITFENYHEYIAGYVLVNDLSARDVQLKLGSLFDKTAGFSKAKGYSGFCPVGLVFLYTQKKQDFELRQYLQRDGKYYLLQAGNSREMINSCYDILKELQRRGTSLDSGDLILTGTPSGVAFKFKVKYIIGCNGKQGFIDFEKANNEKYLRKGDVLIAVSKKLGFQRFKIK